MKILYFLPRFHTNMSDLVRHLTHEGHHIDIIVCRKEPNEDYSCVEPILCEPSIIFSIKRKRFFRKNKNEIKREQYIMRHFFSSVLFLFKTISEKRPEVVIIRDRKRSTAVINWICKILGIKNVVIYSQNPCLTMFEERSDSLRAHIKKIIYPRKEYSIVEKLPLYTDVKYYSTDRFFLPRLVSFDQTVVKGRNYLRNGYINVLDVGKYREYKNHFVLLKAFSLLPENIRGIFRITISGSVFKREEKEYLSRLKEYAKEKNIEQLVEFKESVPYSEMADLYLCNDIFVLTSLREAASIAVVEALRYGLVCVSTHINGTASYIEQEKGLGYIFETDNEEQLSRILLDLHRRKSEIPSIGMESFRVASEKYSVENYFQELCKIIHAD